MKITFPFVCLLLCLCGGYRAALDPPQLYLTNGLIQATVYLPDTAQGYYRGTRFDWSGSFKSLDYKGHSYVGQWFEKYDPKTHDAINGPAEEFVALGYADAKPGQTFVKIGVGVLQKPDDKEYSFARHYLIANPGKWTVKAYTTGKDVDAVAYLHELSDGAGYGYSYTKTVRLIEGRPELVLEHSLTNTGQKTIETSGYNHNFWVIDKQPTGPQTVVRFPVAIAGEGNGFGSAILTRDSSLVFSRTLAKKESVYSAGLKGVKDYDFRIENLKSGAGLRATANLPLEKMVFWACATTVCPEPYVRIRAAPGQTVTWTVRYEFYQNAKP